MLKLRFIPIALAASLGCVAAQEPKNWVKVNGHDAHPTRILVRYKDGAADRAPASVLSGLGLKTHRQFQLVPGLAVLDAEEGSYVADSASPQEKADALISRIEALRNTGQFEYVEPDHIFRINIEPTDEAFQDGTLWGLLNTGQEEGMPGADISATNAWDITTGSTNVIVAVIDTGVRYTHQDLTNQMWRNPGESGSGRESNGVDDDMDGYVDNVYGINAINNSGNPFDDNDHGTHVAGTIGAQANGGGPHVGVAWNVQIMALKFLDAGGSGMSSDAVECLDFAVQKGVQISNNSWGGGSSNRALFDAIISARASNHLFVAAAGNNGLDNDELPEFAYPSTYDLDNIVSVAALDRFDLLADFSNYGRTTVDLGAPGVEIFSSIAASDTSYDEFQGTSMAAPHVSGVAALLMAQYTNETYLQRRERLINTVVTNAALTGLSVSGGRVNAYNALTAAPDGTMELSVTPPSGEELLRGSTNAIFVRISDLFSVTNATVTAVVSTGGELTFINDGIAPDTGTNDNVYAANLVATTNALPPSTTNVTLSITATAPGKTDATAEVTYLVVPPPSNDHFTNAIKIANAGGVVTGRNRFATRETGEPSHAGTSGSRSLWWNWSPAVSGPVLVDTSGSTFDTVIGVYTGANVASLTTIASVDDAGGRLQGFLTFDAIAGTTYRIAIGAYSSSDFGDIRLRVEPNGIPDTGFPQVFVTSPQDGSTVLINESNTVVISGVSIDPAPGPSGVSEVQVRVNNARLASTANGTTNWSSIAQVKPGVNTIQAIAFDNAGNSSSTLISFTYGLLPPPNDHFVNAKSLAGDSGTSTVDTVLATREFGEPNHAGNEGGKSVWWRFTSPADGVLSLTTSNSTFDTLLAVYTGTNLSHLTPVGSNDDGTTNGLFSELNQAVMGGQVYRIAVDGYGGESGTVELSHSFTPTTVFSLTVSNTAGGSVIPGSSLVASNSTVVLTAVPEQDYVFSGWSGSMSSMSNPLSVVVQSDMTLIASFALITHTDGFESGDLSAIGWTTGGDAPWIVQSTNASTGTFAARSGVIDGLQSSSLILTTNLPAGFGSFEYLVSSEQNWDLFEFYVDGELNQKWSGLMTNWSTHVFLVTPGLRTLEWRYRKDISGAAGMDAAFIDNVNLPVAPVAGEPIPAQLSLVPQPDGTLQLQVQGETNQQYIIQGTANFSLWQSLLTNASADGLILFTDPGQGTNALRFYRAVTP